MDTVRAWKDPEYRRSLPCPPQHPSGVPGLSMINPSDLETPAGGVGSGTICLTKTFTLVSPVYCVITLAVC
ncbi:MULTISPECIES: mersacidin/lichenicidin family type 2 lantibiotic [Streptomyces violaceusniger group]|uniref:Mersacidin/lichenicidin family type 2 lantibiotic n=1 Tax=Streptomyces rhizosphaericus TaxID=114699 RepID=A0A6G4AEE5_9ACTN|nr:mersacidin/lichenicidin family type 2 lantibiotic [Streptomyces rhizosphaericus]MBI0379000.1 mersacidin/lichenicidin family type 2 lantibiotic [Streptomyces albiflaviniger]NEW71695.1 mersacidin/lichenicidin family type 2 lantibiotic [Streptomyces rhizosphaericus]